jgi:hypothetical protein
MDDESIGLSYVCRTESRLGFADGFRCVDIFERTDGTFRFKEFRRDPEDAGRWTLIGDYSHQSYPTKDEALRAAASTVACSERFPKTGPDEGGCLAFSSDPANYCERP